MSKCTSCGLCQKVGHCYAIKSDNKKPVINIKDCLGCSTCVDVCPKKAVKMVKN
jgi:MinD superfamily P-loop ATPase